MFMSASRLLPRLASTRLPLNNTPRSSLSRCCNLHANEQGKGVRENPTGAKQAPRPTGTEESAESSRDTFGTLSSSLANRNLQRRLDNEWFQDEDDDEDEFRQKIEDTLRPRPSDYLRQMNELVRRRDLRGALNLLDVDMKREYVQPNEKHFRLLIHACGREGYHSRAISLYRGYRRRNFRVNYGILSDLFNACTNSPFPERALEDAKVLRKSILEQNLVLPEVAYNNMIKAFGRCGDLETAFSIVDEMASKGAPITADTFHHLLHGCISDKESGFRHAVLAWRKLLEVKRVKPNLTTVNLLLRATRDCNIGDSDLTYDVMLACMSPIEAQKHRTKLLESPVHNALESGAKDKGTADLANSRVGALELVNRDAPVTASSRSTPNLLERKPNFDNVVAISGALSNPQDRFLMIGGSMGFFSVLSQHKITPDVKTFSQMLGLVGNSEEDEDDLIDQMKAHGVSIDTGFMNQLLKKRCLRHDYEVARKTLNLMNREGIEADLFSFGILAMAVRHTQESREFIGTLDNYGLRLNAVIMATLFENFGRRHRVRDMVSLLQIADRRKVRPDGKMLQRLESFYTSFRNAILKRERGGDKTFVHKAFEFDAERGFEGWKRFRELYKDYLARTEMEMPAHPWKQFLTSRDIEVSENVPAVKEILETPRLPIQK